MKLSLEQVIERYGSHIYAAAFSLLHNREDAEDVLQDTLLRYYTTNKQFQTEQHLRAWLLRTAINRGKDLLRSARRKRESALDESIASAPFLLPECGEVFEAVMSLPEQYRLIIHLFYYEDCSVDEIAGLFHLSIGAVKTRLFRGRKILKEKLKEEWEDE